MGLFNRKSRRALQVPVSPQGYIWGGKDLAQADLAAHFAVVGVNGSGKTLSLSMLMQSVLGRGETPRARALVYDPKLETYPTLRGLGLGPEAIHVLHPFDARCTPWDIAKDIGSVSTAKQIAAILCPKDKEAKDPYWSTSAQLLLEGVILALCERGPGAWKLNDLVEATSTPDRLRALLALMPETADLVEQFTLEPRAFASIFSTLRSKLGPLGTAAASWGRSGTPPVSLEQWLHGEPSVLLVGADDANDEAVGPITRALFLRASQLITGQPDAGDGSLDTWFFLDEVRLAGYLEGLNSLLLKGRSKGAHVVLGFQDIVGMREVYGPNVGNELVGQCGNLAFLRVTNPDTAEWASKHIGKKEFEAETVSEGMTQGKLERSTTQNRSITAQEKDVVPPQEFMLLQVPSLEKGDGMRGVFAIPAYRWMRTVHSEDIERWMPKPTNDPGFVPAPVGHQRRLLWTDADLDRLGLPELAEPSASPAELPEGGEGFELQSLDDD